MSEPTRTCYQEGTRSRLEGREVSSPPSHPSRSQRRKALAFLSVAATPRPSQRVYCTAVAQTGTYGLIAWEDPHKTYRLEWFPAAQIKRVEREHWKGRYSQSGYAVANTVQLAAHQGTAILVILALAINDVYMDGSATW